MDETNKKCPMCAEEIRIEARVCRHCNARFDVTTKGYCSQDHQMVEADENGKCPICHGELMDTHMVSTLIEEKNLPPARPVQPHKKSTSRTAGWMIGIGLILVGACFMTIKYMRPAVTAFLEAQMTRPAVSPRPTSAHLPVEVNFNSIYDYPLDSKVNIIGQLMLPGGVLQGDVCGVFLRNPTKYYEKITIFLFIPLAGNTPLPNQMARLPEEYSEQDFEVRLDDGNYVGNYATVRITGSICETTDGEIAICTISKIESAQSPASTPTTTLENMPTPSPTVVDNPEMPTPTQAANSPAKGMGIAAGRILWNGQPMAGVTVKLCTNWIPFGSGCQTTEYNAITDNDGHYTISGLPAGDYHLVAINPGQKNETGWLGEKVTVVAGQTVTIQDVNVIKYDLKLTSPDNNATVRSNTPTLEWEAYPDAAYYRVYVLSHDWTFDFLTKVIVNSNNVPAPQYIFQNPLASGKYSWSIHAYNAEGIGISASRSDSYLDGQSYYFLVAP